MHFREKFVVRIMTINFIQFYCYWLWWQWLIVSYHKASQSHFRDSACSVHLLHSYRFLLAHTLVCISQLSIWDISFDIWSCNTFNWAVTVLFIWFDRLVIEFGSERLMTSPPTLISNMASPGMPPMPLGLLLFETVATNAPSSHCSIGEPFADLNKWRKERGLVKI